MDGFERIVGWVDKYYKERAIIHNFLIFQPKQHMIGLVVKQIVYNLRSVVLII